MYCLIDGYNLLFRLGIKSKTLELARLATLELLNERSLQSRAHMIVIFDGKREQGLGFSRRFFKNIEIIYTADGLSADEFIIDFLSRVKNPKEYKIITSDSSLGKQIKELRALSLTIEEFLSEKRSSLKALEEKQIEEEPIWYKDRLQKIFEGRVEEEKRKKDE